MPSCLSQCKYSWHAVKRPWGVNPAWNCSTLINGDEWRSNAFCRAEQRLSRRFWATPMKTKQEDTICVDNSQEMREYGAFVYLIQCRRRIAALMEVFRKRATAESFVKGPFLLGRFASRITLCSQAIISTLSRQIRKNRKNVLILALY